MGHRQRKQYEQRLYMSGCCLLEFQGCFIIWLDLAVEPLGSRLLPWICGSVVKLEDSLQGGTNDGFGEDHSAVPFRVSSCIISTPVSRGASVAKEPPATSAGPHADTGCGRPGAVPVPLLMAFLMPILALWENSGPQVAMIPGTAVLVKTWELTLCSLLASLPSASGTCVFYLLFIMALSFSETLHLWRSHFHFSALLSEDPSVKKARMSLCREQLGFMLSLTTNDRVFLLPFHHQLLQSLNKVSRL